VCPYLAYRAAVINLRTEIPRAPGQLPPGHLHAVWIENEGLHTLPAKRESDGGGFETLVVTFNELREAVCEIAELAHGLYKLSHLDAINAEADEDAQAAPSESNWR
jgi:hypothetical protein